MRLKRHAEHAREEAGLEAPVQSALDGYRLLTVQLSGNVEAMRAGWRRRRALEDLKKGEGTVYRWVELSYYSPIELTKTPIFTVNQVRRRT